MERAGAKLKKMRGEIGISAAKLAALMDVPWPKYNSWENQSKKKNLPVEVIEMLLPTLLGRGIDLQRIWDLAGVNSALFMTEDDTEIEVTNGRFARGIPTENYSHPTDMTKMRYIGKGLLVVATIDKDGQDEPSLYDVVELDGAMALIPYGETKTKPIAFKSTDQWYIGEARTLGETYTCHILLVVRQVYTKHNTEFL